jgi:hypothetical protein
LFRIAFFSWLLAFTAVARGDARGLFRKIEHDGGFTVGFTARGESERTVHRGFMVAREGAERVYSKKNFSKRGQSLIARYLRQHKRELDDGSLFVGGWRDPANGKVYLDLSQQVGSKEKAQRLAHANHQEAYYDVAKKRAVYTHARIDH